MKFIVNKFDCLIHDRYKKLILIIRDCKYSNSKFNSVLENKKK